MPVTEGKLGGGTSNSNQGNWTGSQLHSSFE